MNHSDDLDPLLQQLYRQLPKEQPSPELDAKILAAAGVGAKKRLSWYVPFSMAASVVMVSSLVLYLAKQPETLEQATAVTSLPKRVTEQKIAAPAPAPALMNESVIDEREAVSAVTAEGGSSGGLLPQSPKPSAPNIEAKSNVSVAMDDQSLNALKDIKVEADQNHVANEPAAIIKEETVKEAVVNIASSPQPIIAKQDHLESQKSDNLSTINQVVIADRAMQEQRSLATAKRSESVGSLAKIQAEKKAMAERYEEKAKLAVMKPSVLVIEGVGLGMSGEQLQAQGFSCQMNTCSQTLSHPQQVSYWGMASQNAQIHAVLSNNIVIRLELHQNIATPKQVEESLLTVGIASQKVCANSKSEWVLSRQLETTVIQMSHVDGKVILTLCQ
jgi:hypothetical protein